MNFERKFDDDNNYKCYCGSTIENSEKSIANHFKRNKHRNYDNNKNSTTYYQKNRTRILNKIRSDEYKTKQKQYQRNYYLNNRKERLIKNRLYNSRSKHNTFIKCEKCGILIMKYERTKHDCRNIVKKIRSNNIIRCLCGDVVSSLYRNSLYNHNKCVRHKKRIRFIFNK